MSIRFEYPDANFSGLGIGRRDRLTSIRTNLVGEFQLGRDKETSSFNLVTQTRGVWTGGETFGIRTGDTNKLNWLDTLVEDNPDITIIWAGQLSASGPCNMVSNFTGSPNSDAIFLGLVGSQLNGFSCNTDNTLSFATVPGSYANTTQMGVTSLRINSGSDYTIKSDVFRGGVRLAGQSATATGKTRVKSSRTLGIGGIGGSYSQDVTMSCYGALIYHTYLSDGDLLTIVQDMTNISASRYADHAVAL